MQTDQIDTFLDLCETRHFARTAERLRVTQSTVSARIAALEGELGCRLFSRSRAGTALTSEGLRFEPHARALRRGWAEALHATRSAGALVHLRIGIQHDLAANLMTPWIAAFRAALPEVGFYVEADYSGQMCADLISGALDLAAVYTPRPHPDLHFDEVGVVRYKMYAVRPLSLGEVTPDRYVLGNYCPAFAEAHVSALPGLSGAALSAGQTATMSSLILATGGAGYLLEGCAGELIPVDGAPVIGQRVHVGLHVRNRTRSMHRRLTSSLRACLPRG